MYTVVGLLSIKMHLKIAPFPEIFIYLINNPKSLELCFQIEETCVFKTEVKVTS